MDAEAPDTMYSRVTKYPASVVLRINANLTTSSVIMQPCTLTFNMANNRVSLDDLFIDQPSLTLIDYSSMLMLEKMGTLKKLIRRFCACKVQALKEDNIGKIAENGQF